MASPPGALEKGRKPSCPRWPSPARLCIVPSIWFAFLALTGSELRVCETQSPQTTQTKCRRTLPGETVFSFKRYRICSLGPSSLDQSALKAEPTCELKITVRKTL